LLAEFTEIESGKRADRPQLAAAMAHCRLTGATLVIATKYGKSKASRPDFSGDATIIHAWKRLLEFSAVWAYPSVRSVSNRQQATEGKR